MVPCHESEEENLSGGQRSPEKRKYPNQKDSRQVKSCCHLSSLRLWSAAVGVFLTAAFAGMSPSGSVCTPALTGQVLYWASPVLGCVHEHGREEHFPDAVSLS